MMSAKFSDFLPPPSHCHKSADFVPFVCFWVTPSPPPTADVIYGSQALLCRVTGMLKNVGPRLRELARGSQDAVSRNLGQAFLTPLQSAVKHGLTVSLFLILLCEMPIQDYHYLPNSQVSLETILEGLVIARKFEQLQKDYCTTTRRPEGSFKTCHFSSISHNLTQLFLSLLTSRCNRISCPDCKKVGVYHEVWVFALPAHVSQRDANFTHDISPTTFL